MKADAALLAWTLDQWAICGGWIEQSGWLPPPDVEGAKRAQRIWYMAYSSPPQDREPEPTAASIPASVWLRSRNTEWATLVVQSIARA